MTAPRTPAASPSPSRDSAGAILLVANYASDVGYAWWLMEAFWQAVAEAAGAAGRRCLLVYPQVRAIPDAVRHAPLTIVEFGFHHRTWADRWRALKFVRHHRIRSIYLTDWPYLDPVYFLWRLAGVRRIVVHDHTPGDRPAAAGLRRIVKRSLHAAGVLSADLYVGVSEFIAHRIHASGGVPESKCVAVTNGIRITERPSDRERIRAELGIPLDAILIVMLSRATIYKGLDFAIDSIARLLSDESLRQRVYVVHCGDGPDWPGLRDRAIACGISHNFRLLGHRPDAPEIVAAADLAFHASKGEAMCLAILEFMCAGLPTVVPDLASVSFAIRSGVDGLTYRHGDVEAAASALRRLIEQPHLRQALGQAAARSCRLHFNFDRTMDAFKRHVVSAL